MEERSWKELVQKLVRQGILRSPQVIRAISLVSRDSFLPESVSAYSAVDSPLPIGCGQTISAPHSRPIGRLGETWFVSWTKPLSWKRDIEY